MSGAAMNGVNVSAAGTDGADPTGAMNAIYRVQRHFYDATRKYFLFGRDGLLERVRLSAGTTVLEIGCGTGRNLAKLAQRAAQEGLSVGGAVGGGMGVRLIGLDASTEMLKTARAKLGRMPTSCGVTLVHGWAERASSDPDVVAGGAPDVIIFSYALSMIPPWRGALDEAMAMLKPGGEILIVDFCDQSGWPRWFGALMRWWLALFSVHYRPELLAYLNEIGARGGWGVRTRSIGRGYAFSAVLTKW